MTAVQFSACIGVSVCVCVYTDRGYRRNRLDIALGLQVCLKATQQRDTIATLSL